MHPDKFPDDFPPCIHHLCFAQTFPQPESLHQLWNQFRWRLPSVCPRFSIGKASPFGNEGGTERRIHGET
jgi:hypothetical protein